VPLTNTPIPWALETRFNRPNHAGDWLSKYKGLPPDRTTGAGERSRIIASCLPRTSSNCWRDCTNSTAFRLTTQQRISSDGNYEAPERSSAAKGPCCLWQSRKLPPQRSNRDERPRFHELRQMPPEQRGPPVDQRNIAPRFPTRNANFLSVWCTLPLAPVHTRKRNVGPDAIRIYWMNMSPSTSLK